MTLLEGCGKFDKTGEGGDMILCFEQTRLTASEWLVDLETSSGQDPCGDSAKTGSGSKTIIPRARHNPDRARPAKLLQPW